MAMQVIADGSGNVKIDCPNAGKKFSPEEISAAVLRKMVDDASKFLNDKVSHAAACVFQWSLAMPCRRQADCR